MSDTAEKIEPVDTPDPIAQAIAALTEAARGTRVLGPGTDNEQEIPADFGEIACHVLTAVAANLGGVEELLAVRLPLLVVQGERDPMGRPEEFPDHLKYAGYEEADHSSEF